MQYSLTQYIVDLVFGSARGGLAHQPVSVNRAFLSPSLFQPLIYRGLCPTINSASRYQNRGLAYLSLEILFHSRCIENLVPLSVP